MSSPSLMQPMPIRVFNSNVFSTLTSVGLHGLVLFLVFPYVSNIPSSDENRPSQTPKNVSVIELTPAEENRLPDNSSPSLDIPEFPNNALGDVPVLDSPAFEPSLPNSLSNLPAPPSLPPLPPLSSNNYNRIPIAPPPRSIPLSPPSIQTPRVPSPPTAQPSPDEIEIAQTPQRPDFAPLKDPVPIDELINQGKGDRSNNNTPPEQVAANNSSASPNNSANSTRQDALIGRLVDDIQQGAESLTYNPAGTRREEARRRDLQWMEQTGETLKPTQMTTIKGTYPKAACNLKLEGTAIYNVKVGEPGKQAQPPFMTQSSGYPLLNNQGLQDVQARNFSQSTRVRVVFEPDSTVCPAVARTEPPQTPALPGNNTEKPPVEPTPVEVRREPPKPSPTAPQGKPPVESSPVEVRREPPKPSPTAPQGKPPVESSPVEVRREPPNPSPTAPQGKPPVESSPVEVRREPPNPSPTAPQGKPPVESSPVEVRREPPNPSPTAPQGKPPAEARREENATAPAPPASRKLTPETSSKESTNDVPAPPTSRKAPLTSP